jgi:hypothetical protein
MTTQLVDRVVDARVSMIRDELSVFFPNADIVVATDVDGRAVIKLIEEGAVIGMEFIETPTSWSDPKRYRDYYIALVNKCRVGVIVPKEHAMSARMRMLEFNQRWLFYYQVYAYDDDANLKKVGRPHDDGTRPGDAGAIPGYN